MQTIRPNVIFFDYGNTLASDSDDRFSDVQQYLSERGIAIDRTGFDRAWEAAEAYAGEYRMRNGFRHWKKDRFWYNFCRALLLPIIGDGAPELAEEMHATQFFTNEIYDDTIPVLAELHRRGYRLGVISNWEAPTLHSQFDRFGMTPYFDHILPSYEAEASKPDPVVFEVALEAMSVEPTDAIHVGDSWGCDIVGARGVGMQPVWINEDGIDIPDASMAIEIATRSDLLSVVE